MSTTSSQMDRFITFLTEQRRLDETAVSTFINDKIDCYAVNGMTDDQLISYIPKIGDRIAIQRYCRRDVAALEEGTSTTVSKATESLMTKLKQRRAFKSTRGDERSGKLLQNTNAAKMKRTYQMGLFEEVGDTLIQVKAKRGGGTRRLQAEKTATMAELTEVGKDLFFPNGKCKLGDLKEFDFTMRDFTEEELDPLLTLGPHYENRNVKMLRLYLSCTKTDTGTPSATSTPRTLSAVGSAAASPPTTSSAASPPRMSSAASLHRTPSAAHSLPRTRSAAAASPPSLLSTDQRNGRSMKDSKVLCPHNPCMCLSVRCLVLPDLA